MALLVETSCNPSRPEPARCYLCLPVVLQLGDAHKNCAEAGAEQRLQPRAPAADLAPGSEKALRDTGQTCGTWGLAPGVSHKLSQAQFLPVHQARGEITLQTAQGLAPISC